MKLFNNMVTSILPIFPKKLIWQFSKRYIAGETLDEALQIINKLTTVDKARATIDVLGEAISKLEEAENYKRKYLEIVNRYYNDKLPNGNISLKPTMFGMELNKEVCFKHMRDIMVSAANAKMFVRIDMEQQEFVDTELDIFKRLQQEFPKNIGIVIQAALHRTLNDIENLSKINSPEAPVNIRLCKGIYVNPPTIAYQKKNEIRQKYNESLDLALKRKLYVGIATHDKVCINGAMDLINKYKLGKDQYEFQMLLGVLPNLRKQVIGNGHYLRVYVPFGPD